MLILKDFEKKIKKLILKEGASLSMSFFLSQYCENAVKSQKKMVIFISELLVAI